jgi:hypothetical protein
VKPSVLRTILVLLTLLGILVGRVAYESRRECGIAQEEDRAGRREEAIAHASRAIRWYWPGNPYTLRAVELLWKTGQEAEGRDPALALLAYDSLRGSLHAIRHFTWPHREWIDRADGRIAELRAREQVRREPGTSLEEARAFHARMLKRDERPRIVWVLVAQIGFFGWIASVLGWIWKGFDGEGKMEGRRSLPWVTAVAIFFFLWVIALVRA